MERNEVKVGTNGESTKLSGAENVEVISAAKTLTKGDSGKVFVLKNTTGVAITLPPVTLAGFKVKFIVGQSFATTAFTIVAGTAVIQGGAVVNNAVVPSVNRNTITFAHAAESVGDYVELVSDGVNWYANGVGALTNAITFTTV